MPSESTHTPKTINSSCIKIGPYLTLYPTTYLHTSFSAFGMTHRQFLNFLKELRVPTLEIGTTHLVDVLTFAIALRTALMIGHQNIRLPGSLSRAKHGSDNSKPDTRPSHLADSYRSVLGHILLNARLESQLANAPLLAEALKKATARLLASSIADLLAVENEKLVAAELKALTSSGHTLPADISITPDYERPDPPISDESHSVTTDGDSTPASEPTH